MSISVYKTFSAGEVLTAADLNASLTQITSNGTDVAFPLTKNSSLGGYSLFFDAANTRSMTDSTKGVNLVLTAFNDAKTTVASAATPDIWTGTGRLVDYTGTTTATGFAAASQAGSKRTLLCAAAAPFTAGANMLIDGVASGSTFTATAGDEVEVTAVTTTQFRLRPRLYSGSSLFFPLHICNFRLTLTTATPVTTADVTSASTLYWTPYKGAEVALYDGSRWNIRTSAELSVDVTALTASKMYDVFVYDNAGTPTLETLVWTDDTTRATALTLQNSVLVKTGAVTRRYLGSIRTTAGQRVHDSVAQRWVWNYYNRVARPMRALDATASWTYSSVSYQQARANAANQLDFVIGVSEDAVTADLLANAANTSAGIGVTVAIGLDSTTVPSGAAVAYVQIPVNDYRVLITASYRAQVAAGKHILVWLEGGSSSGTTTWYSDSHSGIQGIVWG